MEELLDDELHIVKDHKYEIGKIILFTAVSLVLLMVVFYFLRPYLPRYAPVIIILIIIILLSRNMTHQINTINSSIKEFIVACYVSIVIGFAEFLYKILILDLLIEKNGWFFNLKNSMYGLLLISGIAFVSAYFVINKLRSKSLIGSIVLIIFFVLVFGIIASK